MFKRAPLHLLQCINEFVVVYWRRVDYFFDELLVTVGVGRGDVKEDLKVLYLVGQRYHLLCGQDIQLHCISDRRRIDPVITNCSGRWKTKPKHKHLLGNLFSVALKNQTGRQMVISCVLQTIRQYFHTKQTNFHFLLVNFQ